VLEVRPIDPNDEHAISQALKDLVGTAPTATEGLISVPVTDPALMPAVVRRLDDAGLAVGELALRKPSLDEVFFSLTGHRTEETQEEAV
jgi:oleandomycin transport system ATP-binding protein